MLVILTADAPPTVTEADVFNALAARCDGSLESMTLEPGCEVADDDHVWVAVDLLRSAVAPEAVADFEAMLAYAGSKGWIGADGTTVRAHVEPS